MGLRIAILLDGVLQQIGTPEEVYFFPVNTFVAGFIGTPAMNLFEGKLVGSARKMYFDASYFRVRLSNNKAQRLAAYTGKDVYFGVRPEYIFDQSLLPAGIEADGSPLSAKVDVIENLGSELICHLFLGKPSCVAKLDARCKPTTTSHLNVVFDMEHTNVFDRSTGLALDTR